MSEEQDLRREFRKGNINFDFLQPEDPGQRKADGSYSGPDRRSGEREGKRGLFNRGRTPRPLGLWHLVLWTGIFLSSAGLLVWMALPGRSVIWLLLLPFALTTLLWSVIMLTLIQTRPR